MTELSILAYAVECGITREKSEQCQGVRSVERVCQPFLADTDMSGGVPLTTMSRQARMPVLLDKVGGLS